MNKSENKNDQGLLKTISSIQFGIVLLVVIALVASVGTLIPQGHPLSFYSEHFGPVTVFLITVFRLDITYRSPLFIGLLILLGVNLVMCSLSRFPSILRRTFNPDKSPSEAAVSNMPVHLSVKGTSLESATAAFGKKGMKLHPVGSGRLYGEKGRFGYLGSTFVHISLLVLLAGGLTTLLTGKRGYIVLENGEKASTVKFSGEEDVPLGFDITLRNFTVEFYDNYPGRPKSYTSSVTVEIPGQDPLEKDIQVNHPLMLNGFTVFQSSYGASERGPVVSAENDTASVALSLKGMPEEMPAIVTLDMVPGEIYPIPGFGDSMKVSINELHRDFKRVAPKSGGTNPAVKIDVLIDDDVRWSVYAFRNFPGMNMPVVDDLPLLFTLKGIRNGPSVSEGQNDEPGYYTVLGVSRDRGIPLVWAGSIIMMVGLVLSFYIRPKRVWVLENGDGDLLIGARTKGDAGSLKEWVQSAAKLMKTVK